MNKIIIILPNTFENKRDSKDLRKNVLTNFQIENIIDLPKHTFQPYVVVGAIILNLTTESPQDRFWKFAIKNDGFTQNVRREKKEGENDFDIFWKFRNGNEKEKLKAGFQRLEAEKIRKEKNHEFRSVPDFSRLWEITPKEQKAIEEEKKRLDLEFLELWKKQKILMEEHVKKIRERWKDDPRFKIG